MTEPAIEQEWRAGRLDSLTSLRFYAALAVFLFHVSHVGIEWWPLNAFKSGFSGVTFFFVLSGFVLVWSYGPHVKTSTFWRRRAARIYPVYLVTTLIAASLLGVVNEPFSVVALVADIALLQAWDWGDHVRFAINGVSWSLSDEAFFYAIFPAIALPLARCKSRRRWTIAMVLLGTTATVSVALGYFGQSALAYTLPPLRSAEFILGIVLALAIRDGWKPALPLLALAVALVATMAVGSVAPMIISNYVAVLPFAALIAWAVISDLNGGQRFLTARWSIYLGEVSYCFYLVHLFVLRLTVEVLDWDHTWHGVSGLLPTSATFLVSLSIAVALHHGVERPGQRYLAGNRKPSRG